MTARLPGQLAVPQAATAETGPPGAETGPAGSQPVEVRFDDRLARALGIPAFGLAIPHLTGLFGPIGPARLAFWVGSLWFVLLSAAIWQGNRWLLLEQRRHLDWFGHPVQKIVMLLAAIVLYTAPLTVAGLAAWYRWAGFPAIDWSAVRTVVLSNVICVVFVTHVYETVFLIKERESDQVRVARLDRARAEAELQAFVAQVDPHFLFNSLNALGHLAETDPAGARAFADRLAEMYRYLLRQRGRLLVPLADELAFVDEYVALMRIRFGAALRLSVIDRAPGAPRHLPPTGLQLLVENAIKHNRLGAAEPLDIVVELARDRLTVRNPRRPRRSARPSPGLGLAHLRERVQLASGRELQVVDAADSFAVVLPLQERA